MRTKNTNKPLIRQILDLVPPWLLQSCVTNTVIKWKNRDNFEDKSSRPNMKTP